MTPVALRTAVRPVVLALAPAAPGISRDTATPCLELLGGSRLIDRLLGTLHGLGLPAPLVITGREAASQLRGVLDPSLSVLAVDGGRREALRTALAHTREELVLVHDAERALTPASVVTEALTALDAETDAVVPVIALTDSVKEVRPEGLRNVDRSTLAGMQSPRLLRRAVLEGVLAQEAPEAAGAAERFDEVLSVLERGGRVRTVPGSHAGFAVLDRLSLWQAQISLGLARDTSHRHGISRRA